ncbi:MAG: exo-alpha-sialidase [Clostridia bacterium]|nr:exo-alpha-sialidase [Clostridia bacterium]
MTSFFQKIVAFFTAIFAFISGLFGLNKDKPEPEPEPTTMMEETTQPIDPAELRLEPEILSEARTILHNPGSIYCYFAWPSIARLNDGRFAVTCSGFRRDHLCPFGQAVMITSADEGKTWSAPVAVIETPLDDRDAGVVPFGENGVIVTSFTNTRAEQRAWNPGNAEFMAYLDTITDEDKARYLGSTFRMSFDGGNTFGDIRISPVTSPHGPMELSDGSLLWVGRTYQNTDLPEEKSGSKRGVSPQTAL